MTIELSGAYTDAHVLVDDESLVEDGCLEQIQSMIDHPAFTEPVRVMPDTHYGAGAPIGFTMPLGERIVPNVVGVDVGCGMAATNLGDELPLEHAERERRVRDVVPMGREVLDYDDAPHLVDEFPFERANDVFERFEAAYRERFGESIDPIEFEFDGYDGEYVKALCDRVLAGRGPGIGRVIASAGTLGGGNHFVEFARGRESGEYWLVIHSGSRYLGLSVAQYWQERATERRRAEAIREALAGYEEYVKFDPETVGDDDLHTWVTGGMGESHVRADAIREAFEGDAVEETFEAVTNLTRKQRNGDVVDGRGEDDTSDGASDETGGDAANRDGGPNEDLDYLEGREAHGYLVDMLFAQQYARWNRELMSEAICDALEIEPVERFQSVHNYVDFRDLTIRKGATPAREGQRLVIPFNMAEGSVLARGTGNEAYHSTAPHGAGRVMSRREAHDSIALEDFEAAMDDVYSESVEDATLDEAPMAYKSADAIADALAPTAEIEEHLDVVHNLKALE